MLLAGSPSAIPMALEPVKPVAELGLPKFELRTLNCFPNKSHGTHGSLRPESRDLIGHFCHMGARCEPRHGAWSGTFRSRRSLRSSATICSCSYCHVLRGAQQAEVPNDARAEPNPACVPGSALTFFMQV